MMYNHTFKDLSGIIIKKKKIQKRKGSIIAPAYKKGLIQISIAFTICVFTVICL